MNGITKIFLMDLNQLIWLLIFYKILLNKAILTVRIKK